MYFHYFVIISPWKRVGSFIWTNLNPFYPRMLCAKFVWNWPSGSGEEDENVKSLRRQLQQRWQRQRLQLRWVKRTTMLLRTWQNKTTMLLRTWHNKTTMWLRTWHNKTTMLPRTCSNWPVSYSCGLEFWSFLPHHPCPSCFWRTAFSQVSLWRLQSQTDNI